MKDFLPLTAARKFTLMTTKITEGVKITVLTAFQPDYSYPDQNHFVFTYDITIENMSEHTVQLMRRHWVIYDSNGEIREVEGEGVVGQQPILEPGDSHRYVSGCNLKSDMGKMKGEYLMTRQFDGAKFYVAIPEFNLLPYYKLN